MEKQKVEHKKWIVIAMVVIIVFWIVVGLFITFIFQPMFGSYKYHGEKAKNAIEENMSYAPNFNEFGSGEVIDYYYFQDNMFLFVSYASVKRVNYTEEEYAKQKDFLLNRESPEAPIYYHNENEEHYILPESEFQINEWNFKVDAESTPPKSFLVFGFNDIENEIAYVEYYDSDLDYIGDSMEDFFDYSIDYNF